MKNGSEKMYNGCVFECVRDFVKFKRIYLRNYSTNRIEIWYGDKAKVSVF